MFINKIKNVLKYLFVSTPLDERYINGFSDWFGSVQGFKQQTFIMVIWCLIVIVFPFIDPNMFHLMAFLTIYSAITQPILAFGNSRATVYMVKLLRNNIHQMQALSDVVEAQDKTIKKLNKLVKSLEKDVEELVEELNEEENKEEN